MKNRIELPELKNPVNSNFREESFTGGIICVGIWAGEKSVAIATYIVS